MTSKFNVQWIESAKAVNIDVIAFQEPIRISLTLQKLPLPKIDMKKASMVGNTIVSDSSILSLLRERARAFRIMPKDKRTDVVLKLTRETLTYGSWKKLQRVKSLSLNLADYVSYGYGNCEHFSSLFALLAQAAELDVIVVGCYEGQLENIIRSDNGEPLFKTVPLGKVNAAHGWNEVRVERDRWIPVDPTANLNGLDNTQRMIFDKARYLHNINPHLLVEFDGLDVGGRYNLPIEFKTGQSETKTILEIPEVGEKQKQGQFNLLVKANSHPPYMQIRILEVESCE